MLTDGDQLRYSTNRKVLTTDALSFQNAQPPPARRLIADASSAHIRSRACADRSVGENGHRHSSMPKVRKFTSKLDSWSRLVW